MDRDSLVFLAKLAEQAERYVYILSICVCFVCVRRLRDPLAKIA